MDAMGLAWALTLVVAAPDPVGVTARALAAPPAAEPATDAGSAVGPPPLVAVTLSMEPGWHVYWRQPGASGMPTQVTLHAPAGITAGETEYPAPRAFGAGGDITYGYEGNVTLFVPVNAPPAARGPMQVLVKWLSCDAEVCIPGRTMVPLSWPPAADDPELRARRASSVPGALPKAPSWRRTGGGKAVLSIPGLPAGTPSFFPELPAGVEMVGIKQKGSVVELEVALPPQPPPAARLGVLVMTSKAASPAFDVMAPWPPP